MKVTIDQHTKAQAIDYANAEADLHGFATNSPEWKAAYEKHIRWAVGTMSVGRNPYYKNPRDEANFKFVFGDNGFCARVAANYKAKRGDKPTKREIAERVKGSINTLVYLFLNGIMNIRTTTEVAESGKIDPSQMSDLQLREGDKEKNKEVIDNQLIMTIVEVAAYEFMTPFFKMAANDIKDVLEGIQYQEVKSAKDMADLRTRVEKELIGRIRSKMKNITLLETISD